MNRIYSLVLLAVTLQFSAAHAALIPVYGKQGPQKRLVLPSNPDDVTNYQIGDVWGKLKVTPETINAGSSAYKKGAMNTAFMGSFMGGATAFYVGKFNGKYIAATNHHVVEGVGCVALKFPYLSDKGTTSIPCEKIIGHWTDIDFGLIILKPSAEQAALLDKQGLKFSFKARLNTGRELLTFGFGTGKNPGQKNMMVNQDNDCKVYSDAEDIRFIADPDTMNPASYKAWSFAHGCDISHGDSGSAFLDRETGEIVGIVWTAATPKKSRTLTREFLDALKPNSPDVWTDLGYTVPANKISEFLTKLTNSGGLEASDVNTVREFLNQ